MEIIGRILGFIRDVYTYPFELLYADPLRPDWLGFTLFSVLIFGMTATVLWLLFLWTSRAHQKRRTSRSRQLNEQAEA